jgi:hypothetical protein
VEDGFELNFVKKTTRYSEHLPRITTFNKIWQFSYQKVCEISIKPKAPHKISATSISVLELFHIKFLFISFSLCCNHFKSLAYEILFVRKVNLFDKIKEVVFSQLLPIQ